MILIKKPKGTTWHDVGISLASKQDKDKFVSNLNFKTVSDNQLSTKFSKLKKKYTK